MTEHAASFFLCGKRKNKKSIKNVKVRKNEYKREKMSIYNKN